MDTDRQIATQHGSGERQNLGLVSSSHGKKRQVLRKEFFKEGGGGGSF